jgi:hypothetical protein
LHGKFARFGGKFRQHRPTDHSAVGTSYTKTGFGLSRMLISSITTANAIAK